MGPWEETWLGNQTSISDKAAGLALKSAFSWGFVREMGKKVALIYSVCEGVCGLLELTPTGIPWELADLTMYVKHIIFTFSVCTVQHVNSPIRFY